MNNPEYELANKVGVFPYHIIRNNVIIDMIK